MSTQINCTYTQFPSCKVSTPTEHKIGPKSTHWRTQVRGQEASHNSWDNKIFICATCHSGTERIGSVSLTQHPPFRLGWVPIVSAHSHCAGTSCRKFTLRVRRNLSKKVTIIPDDTFDGRKLGISYFLKWTANILIF